MSVQSFTENGKTVTKRVTTTTGRDGKSTTTVEYLDANGQYIKNSPQN